MPNPTPLPDIPAARRWWAKHSQTVAKALPIVLGSHTYPKRYADLLTARLEAAEAMPDTLAEAEILRDLRRLRAAIAGGGESGASRD